MSDLVAQSIAGIIQYLGATPILLFFIVMGLAPWIVTIWSTRQQDKRVAKIVDLLTKQMGESEQRYENNVQLVRNYEALVIAQRETNEKLVDLITISTGTLQSMVEYVKNNWWCPATKDPSFLNLLKERKTL